MKGFLNLDFDLKNLIYLWCKLQLWLKWCPRRGACLLTNRRLHIYNGNWTEWSAIRAEIIRVISKSSEHAAWVRFEITRMISVQNCTTQGSITTYLHPFWNRPNTGLSQKSRDGKFWARWRIKRDVFPSCHVRGTKKNFESLAQW